MTKNCVEFSALRESILFDLKEGKKVYFKHELEWMNCIVAEIISD